MKTYIVLLIAVSAFVQGVYGSDLRAKLNVHGNDFKELAGYCRTANNRGGNPTYFSGISLDECKQKCVSGPDDGLCKRIGFCRPAALPINCADVTGSGHPDCVNDNGNHHESFISGISNNFKKFTNSLTNKTKKSIPTRIKSFSKDNNFSYV